ncbi:MAG: zinc-binding dehydrogenase [Planctomycetota bacterium]|nr:zinc-binding dehydrogenase [Planctomycetota bacterium]
MKAVQYSKSIPKYLMARFLGKRFPGIYTGSLSMIGLNDIEQQKLPTREWARVKTIASGICGSDLASICAKGSAYFSPLISTPFVLGHETVGEVIEIGADVTECKVGERVVIEPALGCRVRGIDPLCECCEAGNYAHCERVTEGTIAPGIQTGYCRDTGGGWSESFVAHQSQIVPVPPELSDDDAVLIEPFSCSLHAALEGRPRDDETALVVGCGAIGLLLIASLRGIGSKCQILAIARHPHQQELARRFGANEIIDPAKGLKDELCKRFGTKLYKPEIGKDTSLGGGADVTFDCVASDSSIDDSLRFTAPGGRVILVGMPSIPKGIDWTAIWYRALKVEGVYAYGMENFEGGQIRTFDLALCLLKEGRVDLSGMVGAKFPLSRYREAVRSALSTGSSKAVKTVLTLDH